METKQISKYYDEYITDQVASGVNDRIYGLYKRLLRLGLTPRSNVVELGSGIGTLTFVLSKYIKQGNIEAVDLSPGSIAFAKERITHPNISFFADDVVRYQPAMPRIDFITLFDIIEHIPTERHEALFQNIAAYAGEHTKIVINIPNPAYIEYDREHNPGALQIIDQPLPLSFILENLEKNGLTLRHFEEYSIWAEQDYQYFVVEKKKVFQEVLLSSKRGFWGKALKKLERTYIRMRYRYR
jgi:trans-aconitate 2-methyltransferase